jgi:DNA-binding NtrC family response regulator
LANKVHSLTGKPFQITQAALDVLTAYAWPGNVRELENSIQRACALSESEVLLVSDLPSNLHPVAADLGLNGTERSNLANLVSPESAKVGVYPQTLSVSDPATPVSDVSAVSAAAGVASAPSDAVVPLKNWLRDQEQVYLNRVLASVNGDKEKAAGVLGVSLATLYRKLSGEA